MPEFPEFGGLVCGASKAVKNSAEPAGVGADDFERVGPCVALMHDDVHAQFGSQVELCGEDLRLCGFDRPIVQLTAGGLGRSGTKGIHRRGGAFFIRTKAVIIETRLPDRRNTRVGGQRTQLRDKIARHFMRMGRMNADNRMNSLMRRSQFHRPPAALKAGPDRHKSADPVFTRARKHILKVRSKIRVVEVGVGICQHPSGLGENSPRALSAWKIP